MTVAYRGEFLQDFIQNWAAVVGALVGTIGLLTLVVGYYRKTWGRRRGLARKLNSIAPGLSRSHLVDLLGEPRMTTDFRGLDLLVWAWQEAYVQAAIADNGTAMFVSITARTSRFRPRLLTGEVISSESETLEVRLGETTYGELPGVPEWIRGDFGARRFGYEEGFYFGNPGRYCHYAYALNDAGAFPGNSDLLLDLLHERQGVSVDGQAVEQLLSQPDVTLARSECAFNTLTIGTPHLNLEKYRNAFGLGVDADTVRLIPE